MDASRFPYEEKEIRKERLNLLFETRIPLTEFPYFCPDHQLHSVLLPISAIIISKVLGRLK